MGMGRRILRFGLVAITFASSGGVHPVGFSRGLWCRPGRDAGSSEKLGEERGQVRGYPRRLLPQHEVASVRIDDQPRAWDRGCEGIAGGPRQQLLQFTGASVNVESEGPCGDYDQVSPVIAACELAVLARSVGTRGRLFGQR
jgi:hypothetical protein